VKKFPFSLSWKLTLCSILMMLLMWAAVGVVLVLNTAEEIMAAQDDEAQRQAELVTAYGDVDVIGSYYRLHQGDHWIEEAGQRRSEVLFPKANSSWHSRYSQYTVIRPIGADYDSKTVWAETFIGIQVQGAPEGEPWNDQYLIFLERYSPDDLYAIQELVDRSGGAAPIRAVGHADLRHRFFRADTITIGDTSFTNHQTNGQDTYFLGESGEPLEENSYYFSLRLLDRTRMEMLDAVRCHVHGLTTAHPLHERQSSILESYSSGYAFQYNNEEPDLSYSAEVFLISTPLKSALQEHLGILLRLLILAPVLGLAFAWAIRKIVVCPLEKTKADFGRVARLDFRGLEGDTRRRDEIGGLNRDLRQMAAELQARWDDERALEQRRQDFVGAASHELKTPLALMRGYAEGLEQGIGDREAYLARMEAQIDRMDRLVLELLDQTRLERMEQLSRMEQVDLTGLIRTLLKQMAPLFVGLTVRTELQEGCSLSGDQALLERAYGNLLSNAARYCTPGGQVQIQLERAPYAPVFTIWNHAGPIPETELPRLFEPFYRGDTARDRSGSGMGLAIARKIFTLHHLTIAAENAGDGVRFSVQSELRN
jgi:signal transduction histidine kinase